MLELASRLPSRRPRLLPDHSAWPVRYVDEAPETLLKEDEGNLPNANMEMRRRFEANCRRCAWPPPAFPHCLE